MLPNSGGAHGSNNEQSLRRYQKSGPSFPALRNFLLTNADMGFGDVRKMEL
jgi:hypothetical protein